MQNQETQVNPKLQEAIILVQKNYKELKNIKPSLYTKEEYEEICDKAVEENSLALDYVQPEYLKEDIYKKICKFAVEWTYFNEEDSDNHYDDHCKVLNFVKKDFFLNKKDYKDICCHFIHELELRCFHDDDLISLDLIDYGTAEFLGRELYIELCKDAFQYFKNLAGVKNNVLKEDDYYNLCKEAIRHCSDSLLYAELDLLTTEQLNQLLIQSFKGYDTWYDHPLAHLHPNLHGCSKKDDNYSESDESINTAYDLYNDEVHYSLIYKRLQGDYYNDICKQEVKKYPMLFQHIDKTLLYEGGKFLYINGILPQHDDRYNQLALIAIENYENNDLKDHPLKFLKSKSLTTEDYNNICIKAVTKHPESFNFVYAKGLSNQDYKKLEMLAKNYPKDSLSNNEILDEQNHKDVKTEFVQHNKKTSQAVPTQPLEINNYDKNIGDLTTLALNNFPSLKRTLNETTINQDSEENNKYHNSDLNKKQQVTEGKFCWLLQKFLPNDEVQNGLLLNDESNIIGQPSDEI